MTFITQQDLATHLYEGVITAISDNNTDLLTEAINAAIAEVEGYLGAYDIDAIFAETDKTKYANLRMYVKDLAKWHFINICNVSVDFEIAEIRYKNAIAELGKIQTGKVTPRGWPVLQTTDNTPTIAFSVSSRPKRNNTI